MSANSYLNVGQPEAPPAGLVVASAGLLAAAIAALLLSGAMLIIGTLSAHYLGYACAPIAFLLVALHRRMTVVIAGRFGLLAPTWVRLLAGIVVVAGIALAGWHAYLIARHYA